MVLSDSHSARSLNDIIITLSEPDLTWSLHYIVTYLPSYVGDSVLLCLKKIIMSSRWCCSISDNKLSKSGETESVLDTCKHVYFKLISESKLLQSGNAFLAQLSE